MANNFPQYQQNEQSSLSSNHWKQKMQGHMMLEIQVLVWDRHTDVAGLIFVSLTFNEYAHNSICLQKNFSSTKRDG